MNQSTQEVATNGFISIVMDGPFDPCGLTSLIAIVAIVLFVILFVTFYKNRKEAKKFFGTSYYFKIEREKREIKFLNDNNYMASNELFINRQEDSRL